MLRTVGRLVLIGVGIAMIVIGIININSCLNEIKTLFQNWQTLIQNLFKGDASSLSVFTNFLYQCFLILVGVSGLLAGIFNRCGFWFTIFSLILLALLIVRFINEGKAGKLKDIQNVFKIIGAFGLQIGYVAGFIILKIAKKRS